MKKEIIKRRNPFYSSDPFRLLRIIIVLVLLFFLSVCSSKTKSSDENAQVMKIEPVRVVGLGRIEPELKILELSSDSTGIITKIHVEPGENLNKGGILIELDKKIQDARVKQVAAQIRAQSSQIEASKAALAAVKIKTENARISFNRAKTLFDQNAEARFNYDLAKTEYESLVEETKRLQAVVITEKNLLELYRAEREFALAELDKRDLKAPLDGQILALDVTVGSLISQQTIYGTFAPESPLTVWSEIDELFAERVEVGQKARIRLQGSTEILSSGKVIFAGPYLRKKSIFSDEVGDLEDRRVREVRIKLDRAEGLLFGMRVECLIDIEKE
jgi:multidrug efflux pump subunit AcrA (membrane-fusion protein)